MRFLRTFAALLSVATLGLGASACGADEPGDSDATTTTGVTPGEVEDPGEGDNLPGDPNTPDPGTGEPEGGNQDEPGAGVGGEQSNPY